MATRAARPTTPLGRLQAIAGLVDAASPPGASNVLLHVVDDGNEVVLGLLHLDPERHPCDQMRGLVAAPEWWALGIVVAGRARFLDQPERDPESITSTYFVERGGAEVSLMRRGDEVVELTGRVEGRIPDLLRGALGLGS